MIHKRFNSPNDIVVKSDDSLVHGSGITSNYSGIIDTQIYDIGNNAILSGNSLGQVGTDWAFVTLGGFNGSDTTDMLLRSASTGGFEVYDISNNNITGAAALGTVGLGYQVAGFGNFNGPSAGTDMMMRNSSTGAFELKPPNWPDTVSHKCEAYNRVYDQFYQSR